MALKGTGTGGCMFALPAGFDDGADLSVFFWLRRASNPAGNSRVFNLVNTARNRGFVIHIGGNASGTTLVSDVLVSVSSGNENTWGADSNQAGRGRATVQGLTDTEFAPLAFSVRGIRAPDNTGTGSVQQIHEVWWKGANVTAQAVGTGSLGSGVPKPGGYATLLCRESGNLAALDGWVAEVAVWQDHRLTDAEALRLSRGASPLSVQPGKLLFYRSFRQNFAAEVGNTTLNQLGAGATIDTANHPPLLVEPEDSSSVHATHSSTVQLSAAQAATPVSLVPADTRHEMQGGQAALAAAGRLTMHAIRHGMSGAPPVLAVAGRITPHGGRHGMLAGSLTLLPPAGVAAVFRVPPESRVLIVRGQIDGC